MCSREINSPASYKFPDFRGNVLINSEFATCLIPFMHVYPRRGYFRHGTPIAVGRSGYRWPRVSVLLRNPHSNFPQDILREKLARIGRSELPNDLWIMSPAPKRYVGDSSCSVLHLTSR